MWRRALIPVDYIPAGISMLFPASTFLTLVFCTIACPSTPRHALHPTTEKPMFCVGARLFIPSRGRALRLSGAGSALRAPSGRRYDMMRSMDDPIFEKVDIAGESGWVRELHCWYKDSEGNVWRDRDLTPYRELPFWQLTGLDLNASSELLRTQR